MYLGQESWNSRQGAQKGQPGQQQQWQQTQQQQWAPQQQQQWQQPPQQRQQWPQAQQQPPQPPQRPASSSEVGQATRFSITGCTHDVVGPIIRGDFSSSGSNHGKPAYKKDAAANGLVVMIYFWDERDGAASSGWWIGPQIGGNMVWGHHPNRASATPPLSGWQAPHSAPPDASMKLTVAGAPQAAPQAAQGAGGKSSWGSAGGKGASEASSWGSSGGKGGSDGGSWGSSGKDSGSWGGGSGSQWGGKGQQQQWQQSSKGEWSNGQSAAQQQLLQQQLQKQQQQQQFEDQRKKMEEANKKRLAEQQAKLAEQKRQQEETQRKKAEEQRKKMEEMRRQQGEQKAAMTIRQVVQKLRLASPESFDSLKEELAKVLGKEFDNCGAQKAKLQEESDKALEQAAQKVEQIKEKRIKDEEARKEADKKKQEAIEKAGVLLTELSELTDTAEASVKEFQGAAEKFAAKTDLETEGAVNKAAAGVETASKEASEKVQACLEFMKTKNAEMRVLPPAPMKKPAKVGEEAKKEEEETEEKPSLQALQKVQLRVGTCRQNHEKEVRVFTAAQQAALRKACAKSEMKKVSATFKKYCKGKDGLLTKKEISTYAKTEYKFTMPDAALDMIFKVIAPDAKGVKEADFQRVKAAVGVARERAQDKERRVAREAHEKVVAEAKEKLQAKISDIAASVKEAEMEVVEAGKQSRALAAEGRGMKSPAMFEKATEVEGAIKSASEKAAAAKEKVGEIAKDEEVDKDLTMWLQSEKHKLSSAVGNIEGQVSRATAAVDRFKGEATRKDTAEVKELHKKAMGLLKAHQAAKEMSPADLFSAIDKSGSGSFGVAEFSGFVGELSKAAAKEDEPALTEEELGRVFAALDEEKEGSVAKDSFEAILMVLMKVVKDVAITDGLNIKEAKSLRRLEVGEVVQVLGGPVQEEKTEVKRIKAKTMGDGLEGWVTIAGNQGSVFLKDGVICKVVKETILTPTFEIEASKEEARKIKESTRKLKPGELLEIREWGKKQEETGLTRMKCKVKSDGNIGYVTTLGNTGIKFVDFV